MCGIVGMVGSDIGFKEKQAFSDLLRIDTIRGEHSTGVLAVSSTYETNVIKKAVEGFSFVDLQKYDTLMKSTLNPKLLLGHNRHATRGKINNANAHPFSSGETHLVHNGSLISWSSLHNASHTNVDSEAVCFNVEHEGLEETVGKLHGAFALGVYNENRKEFSLIRNDERPMWYAPVKGKDLIIFASEPLMIEMAACRNDIELGEYPRFLPEATLMTFSLDQEKGASKFSLKRGVRLYEPPLHIGFYGNEYDKGWSNNYGTSRKKTTQSFPPRNAQVVDIEEEIQKKKEETASKEISKNSANASAKIKKLLEEEYSLHPGDIIHGILAQEDFTPYPGQENMRVEHGKATFMWCNPEDPEGTQLIHTYCITKALFDSIKKSGRVVEFKVEGAFAVPEVSDGKEIPTGRVMHVMSETEEEYFWSVFTPASSQEVFIDDDGGAISTKGLSNDRLTHLCRDGCCVCSDPIDSSDFNLIFLIDDEDPLCPKCTQDWSIAAKSTGQTIKELVYSGLGSDGEMQ